uniref:Amidohydrolase family protein n=1 Tax=Parastrongyloides trichosuri TaxID=131310 RepID=A0A0N4ZAQ8_PARTI
HVGAGGRLHALGAEQVLDAQRRAFQRPALALGQTGVAGPRLCQRLVRRHLDIGVQRRVGGLDIGQEGLGQFFRREGLGLQAVDGVGQRQLGQIGHDLLHDLGHDEEAVGGFGRVGQDVGDLVAVRHHVVAQAQGLGHVGGHRLDALHVHLVQLFDPLQDAVQLLGQRLQAVLGGLDAGEMRNLAHQGRDADRHRRDAERHEAGDSGRAPCVFGRGGPAVAESRLRRRQRGRRPARAPDAGPAGPAVHAPRLRRRGRADGRHLRRHRPQPRGALERRPAADDGRAGAADRPADAGARRRRPLGLRGLPRHEGRPGRLRRGHDAAPSAGADGRRPDPLDARVFPLLGSGPRKTGLGRAQRQGHAPRPDEPGRGDRFRRGRRPERLPDPGSGRDGRRRPHGRSGRPRPPPRGRRRMTASEQPIAIINARLLDPASDYDGPGAVLIADGRIVEVIHGQATQRPEG